MANEVVIYTTPICPYCVAAKNLLRQKGVTWREVDIASDSAQRDDMIRRSGRRTVPQIFVGATHVGGFDDLTSLEQRGGLDPLLAQGQ